MRFFDTHAHYDDDKFEPDRDTLVSSLPLEGVTLAVDVGCSFDSVPKAFELAKRYEHIYFSAGFHPCDAEKAEMHEDALAWLKPYLLHPKCVAIGEIGLDYHYDEPSREIQKKWFIRQLELALEMKKPVIIHDREAHGDVMDILRAYPAVKGILHSFSGSPEMARELIKLGWYISFSGVLTFKNAARLPEVARVVPNDRILLETDCPYLAPHPFRGRRNDSTLMRHTAERLAEIRGVSLEEIAALTYENALKVYNMEV